MFPIRDINPVAITPWAKFVFIGLCVAAFFLFQTHESSEEAIEFLFRRAAIACEVTTGQPLTFNQIVTGNCADVAGVQIFPEKNPLAAMFTSMFLHGDLLHLGFNMWFMWIFGNNVEEAFGHVRFILFYILGGLAATLAFVFMNVDSTVPLVGASGAIAAVMGSYAVLYPRHQVLTLIGWFPFHLPAALFLGVWFLIQFGMAGGNVAWEAHVGGFVFGLVVTLLLRRSLMRRVAT